MNTVYIYISNHLKYSVPGNINSLLGLRLETQKPLGTIRTKANLTNKFNKYTYRIKCNYIIYSFVKQSCFDNALSATYL